MVQETPVTQSIDTARYAVLLSGIAPFRFVELLTRANEHVQFAYVAAFDALGAAIERSKTCLASA